MRIITVISSISNEVKEVNLGDRRIEKGRGNEAPISFADLVNYLKNSHGEESFKAALGKEGAEEKLIGSNLDGNLLDEESQDSIGENSYIGELHNILNLFLTRTIPSSENENGKEIIAETLSQEGSRLLSLLKSGNYEVEELLVQLKETGQKDVFIDLIKQMTTLDEFGPLSNNLNREVLSNYSDEKGYTTVESLEDLLTLNKVSSSSEGQKDLNFQWNRATLMNKQEVSKEDEMLFGEKADTISKINTEENSISKDVTFLKSLLVEKDSIKGNYLGVIHRTPIENNYTSVVEAPVINGKTLQEDLIKVINYASKGNIQEIKVKINPEELGSIIVRLTLEENSLKAKVRVSSEETYKLLINNIGELNNSLKAGEIKIQEVEISLFSEEGFYYSEESRSNNYGSNERNTNKHSSLVNEDLSKRDEEVINPSEIPIEGTINSLV